MNRSLAISIQVMANHVATTTRKVLDMYFLRLSSGLTLLLVVAVLLAVQQLLSAPLSARYVSDKTTGNALAVTQATLAQPAAAAQPLGGIVVRAASVPVEEGQTSLDASLELAGATAELNVGAVSVDVQYDAALLKATACAVSDSFDLLLCNIATPGVIQLAGVAAGGIRSELTIADLGFEILQPDNLFTQLTVQLDTIADVEGATVNATAQHGQIGTPCVPGSEGCAISAVIHLPLVHR
jgi:hypothetical protein